MKREECTRKLIRMIEAIRSADFPARIREFYVFGSYARGAVEPGDLDVLLVHENSSQTYRGCVHRELQRRGHSIVERIAKAASRFRADMCRPLRKPGERIEILLASRCDDIVGPNSKIKPEDLILLWSESDPDYRAKLDAIRADPSAGRAPRDHFVDLERLDDNISTMERAVEMVRNEELVLVRLPVDNIECRLNAYHSHWLAWWAHCKVMGKHSMKLLPYAMWWLQKHRQASECPDSQCIVWSKSGTHRVHLGRPSLGWMLGEFRRPSKVTRQCLIPHIKRARANELLVFERGKNWSNEE